jgi:hypothetical protein
MFLMQRAMIEPGVRYLPTAPPPLATHMALEAAVDLSIRLRKTRGTYRTERTTWRPRTATTVTTTSP